MRCIVATTGWVLVVIGGLFDLFGCIGLVRLPDVYNRLQAATKCVTLGTCAILIGTAFISGQGAVISKTVLCSVFILLTSPVAAHALARAAHRSGIELCDQSVVDKYKEAEKTIG